MTSLSRSSSSPPSADRERSFIPSGPMVENEKMGAGMGNGRGPIYGFHDDGDDDDDVTTGRMILPANMDRGTQPDSVYDSVMSPWRAKLRKFVMRNLTNESRIIAKMQERIRTPWFDTYFVYTSSLGTHTFFLTALPALFFFGRDEMARGLIFVLALGVYVTSFIKDLVCAPRPYAPHVIRLTMGTHHLEYGFPSTHSTNSVSIALLIFSYIYPAYLNSSISHTTYIFSSVILAIYVFSIVFGRLYTGMHSFMDCTVGILVGAGVWGVHFLWGKALDQWVVESQWFAPTLVTALGLLAVNQHPQPIDDCPCFEDAIAFMAVLTGIYLARWHSVRYGFTQAAGFFKSSLPGHTWQSWSDIATWYTCASLKLTIGILIIFSWRLLAKSASHFLLPPLFRRLASLVDLPARRFYTPATEYDSVPVEYSVLRPIPSVIDLPGMMEEDAGAESAEGAVSSSVRGLSGPQRVLKARFANNMKPNGNACATGMHPLTIANEKNGHAGDLETDGDREERPVKHYDADVLTKVFVYAGIAILSAELIPIMFEYLGWGVL